MTKTETRVYDESSAQEILRLAGEARRRMDYFSAADLERAAAEVGVPATAIQEAIKIFREKQSEEEDRSEYRRLKLRHMLKNLVFLTPLVIFLFFAHSIFHFFSVFSSFFKSIGAVIFAGATGHEMDFRSWRAKRYDTAHVHIKPKSLFEFMNSDDPPLSIDGMVDALREQEGMSYETSVVLVEDYLRAHPDLFPMRAVKDWRRANSDMLIRRGR